MRQKLITEFNWDSHKASISSMRLLLALVCCLLCCVGAKGGAIQADCVTPTNGVGKCVEVRFCTSIMTALINNDHLTNPVVAKYLRESQCGLKSGSHRVCCTVSDIDFGGEIDLQEIEATTSRLATDLQPPKLSPSNDNRLSDVERCGRLHGSETPLKWVGELWFSVGSDAKSQLESKCLGTLISRRHLVVPAHCVASLPENISLDYVKIQETERSVSKIFIHASYNQPKFANDIAIIELDKENGDEINDAVCMPESQPSEQHLKSTLAIVKRARDPLRFGKAQPISTSQCREFFNQQLNDLSPGQFCANVQSNGTTFSPFIGAIVVESDGSRQYTFRGFTSTAVRTGQAFDESKPYIFTDLAHHMAWIRAAIGKELQSKPAPIVDPNYNLKPCQTSTYDGFCVKYHQCSIYRDAPPPLSQRHEEYLNTIRCFTSTDANQNSVNEDGLCCVNKYIELDYNETIDFDERFQFRRGAEVLDTKKCGQVDPTRRIVGGTKADLKEFPWIGLVKYQVGRIFKFTCGSSLISSRYVLTCAHCITNLPIGYEVVAVRLGEYDRTTDPDCKLVDEDKDECNPPVQDIAIGSLIPHPKYNSPRYANDIGLVRLSKSPDMTQGIIPICLPVNDEMQQTISDKYTVAGFGFTENGRDSDVLLKVVLPKVEKEACQSFHSSVIQLSEGHQCYGGEGVKDSCKGDSGNPLMNYVNLKGRIKAVQMGIVTAGHTMCGRGASGFPGVYSDVTFYMAWILSNLEE